MSWSSLFAFDRPNGEVGRQYSATSTIIPNVSQLFPNSNNKAVLATFNFLPIGVYNVSFQISINWKQGIDIEYGAIGLSQVPSSGSPVVFFPQVTFAASQSQDATTQVIAPLNANFIFSVTNANPYYIWIDTTIGGSVTPVFTSTANCIATKLA
jgi:hypothetical protein